jgi:hypothetical protein
MIMSLYEAHLLILDILVGKLALDRRSDGCTGWSGGRGARAGGHIDIYRSAFNSSSLPIVVVVVQKHWLDYA